MSDIAASVERAAAPSRGRNGMLLLSFMVVACSYVDRSIITILCQPIKEHFQLNDTELGILGGLAFALLYTIAGIPLARLAEAFNRVMIVGVTTAVWSILTALCGLAPSFIVLLLCRFGIGISEAGASPAIQSLIGDYFPPDRRASALAVSTLGGPVGVIAGAALAGMVANAYGWRVAFFVIGIPGVLLALAFVMCVKEPDRGAQDSARVASAAAGKPPSLRYTATYLARSPTFRNMVIGAAIANFALQGIFQFLGPFLLRRYDSIGLREVGFVLSLTSGLCAGLGTLLGGFVTDWAARRDARWRLWVPAGGLLSAGVLYVLAFTRDEFGATVAMLIAPALLGALFLAPLLSVTQNLVGPRMRATAFALMMLVTATVGVACGPVITGWLSDIFAAQSFRAHNLGAYSVVCGTSAIASEVAAACRSASAAGIQPALLLASTLFLPAGLLFLRAARSIRENLQQARAGNIG